jgi:hypothetical protein
MVESPDELQEKSSRGKGTSLQVESLGNLGVKDLG